MQQRLAAEPSDSKRNQERLGGLEGALAAKTIERDRILTLFRKGRIKDMHGQVERRTYRVPSSRIERMRKSRVRRSPPCFITSCSESTAAWRYGPPNSGQAA
jgi:hypothetical protein